MYAHEISATLCVLFRRSRRMPFDSAYKHTNNTHTHMYEPVPGGPYKRIPFGGEIPNFCINSTRFLSSLGQVFASKARNKFPTSTKCCLTLSNCCCDECPNNRVHVQKGAKQSYGTYKHGYPVRSDEHACTHATYTTDVRKRTCMHTRNLHHRCPQTNMHAHTQPTPPMSANETAEDAFT